MRQLLVINRFYAGKREAKKSGPGGPDYSLDIIYKQTGERPPRVLTDRSSL